jgi:hypothetical protein
MIVDAFLAQVRNVLYGDSETMPTHMAIGTGTTGEAANDTALETEIQPDGANRSAIDTKSKPSSKTVQFQMDVAIGEANGNALTETGLLNAASGGTLANRLTHMVINKTAAFELRYQHLFTMSDV